MLPHMDLLRPFGQYWFVTITPYGPEIEPHVPPVETVLRDFIDVYKRQSSPWFGGVSIRITS